jgi:putative transposase
MGVTHFLTTSDGDHVANPRHLRRFAATLADAQREADALKPPPGRRSSRRHKRAKERVARLHAKVARCRLDFHHKVALDLVRRYDVICREVLAMTNMSRSASGTVVSPGTKVAAKSGLNRSIQDAAWGRFFAVLASAAESATKTMLTVAPRYTSQLHHWCGQRGVRNGEVFWCPHCSKSEHADTNAARNILRAGLALQVAPAA